MASLMVPLRPQRFFRWAPNKVLPSEAAYNHTYQGSWVMTGGSKHCCFAPRKPLDIGQQSKRMPKKKWRHVWRMPVMRWYHQRYSAASRCPRVVMLEFFLLGEGDQSDSAVSWPCKRTLGRSRDMVLKLPNWCNAYSGWRNHQLQCRERCLLCTKDSLVQNAE
jgi:hypothetical protein